MFLEGHEEVFSSALQAVLNPKKKIVENCSPDMKTDNELNATF